MSDDQSSETGPAGDDPLRLLVAAVDHARGAAVEEAAFDVGPAAAAGAVGEHVSSQEESPGDGPGRALTHFFGTSHGGYRGWRWAVTLACAGPGEDVTVSEVVLVPGPDALVAPTWVPWNERVRAGDLGPGDLLPPAEDDERLVPGYVESDDPAVEDVAVEVGLGRTRVLSRVGRLDAAARWQEGPRGPAAQMARSAPGVCGTCGFLIPLAGSMRAGFGACANEFSPGDGAIVAVDFGCGAHSDVAVEAGSPVQVAALVYDDGVDLEPVES